MKIITLGRALVGTGVLLPAGVLYASQTTTKPSKKVNISELPIYGDPEVKVKFVDEEIGQYRKAVSAFRETVWPLTEPIKELKDSIKEKYEIGKAHTQSTIDYLKEDEGTLPRIGVITVSGLTGFVLGYRGGYLRIMLFTSFAVLTAMALCYPQEAVGLATSSFDSLKSIANPGEQTLGKNSDSEEK